MSKTYFSQSSCNKGHLSLFRYNALYFLSLIVDYDAEHSVEDVVKAICEKTGVNYSENYSVLDSNLFNYLYKNYGHNDHSESYWKIYFEGIIEIIYDCQEIFYKSSNGEEFVYRFFENSNLYINENKVEEESWDEGKINKFIDDIETLFSVKQKKITDYNDIFFIAWSRFEKGDKWRTRDQMVYAAELIKCKNTEKFTKEHYDGVIDGCLFITKKWFLYLWECKDKGTPEEYIMSLKTFISKNQSGWSEHGEDHVAINKIYTQEHEEIKKCFINEIEIFYKTLWESI